MKLMFAPALLAAFVLTVPAHAFAGDTKVPAAADTTPTIRDAADRAVRTEALQVAASDVPTPLFYKGKFYILNGGKRKLLCVEPADGKIVWSGDLVASSGAGRTVFESSPTAADDKIYVMDHKGNVFVAAANTSEFKQLATAAMGDATDNSLRSSIAISQGQLFIRTGSKLYCVGKK